MLDKVLNNKFVWLVTGVDGFIGSHIAETLLHYNQNVIGLDNLSACNSQNIDYLRQLSNSGVLQGHFEFLKADITNPDEYNNAFSGVDFVLHNAAIGSVPLSFEDPSYVNNVNVNGFLNILGATGKHNIKSFVYASSSAIYGNSTKEPNEESQIVQPSSPYAVSKYTNELYAQTLAECLNINCIGLRYFNIYGSRQRSNGAYAAVIPKWVELMKNKNPIEIYGDGSSVRDFCHVKNVVQANILAAFSQSEQTHRVYNIGTGMQTTLKQLFEVLSELLEYDLSPTYKQARLGDVHLSCANITKAKVELDFLPSNKLKENLSAYILQN